MEKPEELREYNSVVETKRAKKEGEGGPAARREGGVREEGVGIGAGSEGRKGERACGEEKQRKEPAARGREGACGAKGNRKAAAALTPAQEMGKGPATRTRRRVRYAKKREKGEGGGGRVHKGWSKIVKRNKKLVQPGDDHHPNQAQHARAQRRHADIGVVRVCDGGAHLRVRRVILEDARKRGVLEVPVVELGACTETAPTASLLPSTADRACASNASPWVKTVQTVDLDASAIESPLARDPLSPAFRLLRLFCVASAKSSYGGRPPDRPVLFCVISAAGVAGGDAGWWWQAGGSESHYAWTNRRAGAYPANLWVRGRVLECIPTTTSEIAEWRRCRAGAHRWHSNIPQPAGAAIRILLPPALWSIGDEMVRVRIGYRWYCNTRPRPAHFLRCRRAVRAQRGATKGSSRQRQRTGQASVEKPCETEVDKLRGGGEEKYSRSPDTAVGSGARFLLLRRVGTRHTKEYNIGNAGYP
ncbi:hypothetical protein C8R47DRAFT_1071674 [Mycena vitilis]|nr:hypothetical protein C8R47DRAFT_1071674 [Mycena vitilis]